MDYRYKGVGELGSALRRRDLSTVELAAAVIAGLDTIGRAYNAVATVLPGRAVAAARRAQRAIDAGDGSPLRGIPYAVKDLYAVRGAPTTWGSKVYADRVIDDDAVSVRRINRRGGVLAAKLALSEFAGGGRPRNPGASMHGQGRNPWDPTRYSGGSSSGSGIAVALGLVPFALGTETGGSILGPSAFSGVTGLRPTFDLIPTDGVMVLSWTLDKVGPLARSAEDCATALSAMAGSRFRPMSWPEIDDAARRVRVAWLDVELEEAAPEVREPVGAGAAEFRRLVGRTVEIGIDRRLPYIDALEDIVRVEGGFERRDLLRDPTFEMSDARQLATLRSGLDVPSADYLAAIRATVPATRAAFDSVFEHADVILSASRTTIAPSLTEERPPRDATKMSDLLRAAGNLAGVPGVSFPCGLSANGMPVGLQIVGPRGSDALLLGLAAAFQRATDHHLRRPPEPA